MGKPIKVGPESKALACFEMTIMQLMATLFNVDNLECMKEP